MSHHLGDAAGAASCAPGRAAVRVLAISGSLRPGSSNAVVLKAASLVAPRGLEIDLYDGLPDLPAFNPDHDRPGVPLPPAAGALRDRVAESDALLTATPHAR